MKKYTQSELANAAGGRLLTRNTGRLVYRIINQPNFPEPGSLYVLLRGVDEEEKLLRRLSRQRMAMIAVAKGHGLDVSQWEQNGIGVLEVDNVQRAYFALAAYHRAQFQIPVVEVVGSSGKTTTKELVGAVLNRHMKTLVGRENFNSPHGVVFNLLRLREEHRAAVLEAGMLGYGEIGVSSSIIKPNIAILTCLQRAHFGRLGSMDAILAAKAEVLDSLASDGCLILNGEDEHSRRFPIERFAGEVRRVGLSPQHDLWAEELRWDGQRMHFAACRPGERAACSLPTFGRYNVINALAALMAGLQAGLSLEEASQGLADFRVPPARLQIEEGRDGMMLVNDNFNANPDSTRQLLEEIPSVAQGRPLILIMGDMEKKDARNVQYARDVHREIGRQIGRMNFTHLIAVGRWASEYVEGALAEGVPKQKVSYFATVGEAASQATQWAVPDAVVVCKGSPYVAVRKLLPLFSKDDHEA